MSNTMYMYNMYEFPYSLLVGEENMACMSEIR